MEEVAAIGGGLVTLFFISVGRAGIPFLFTPAAAGLFTPALLSPLGIPTLLLADFWALSHPAKSGSPSSSKGVGNPTGFRGGGLDALVVDVVVSVVVVAVEEESVRASKKLAPSSACGSSSGMSPQASSKVSAASSSSAVSVGVRMSGTDAVEPVRAMLGAVVFDVRAWRAKVLAEDVRCVGSETGVEEERLRAGVTPLGLDEFAWISPLAAAILLVKEEMAQPAQEAASFEGVPIRGVAPFVVDAAPAGGRAVSGSVEAYLRIRERNISRDF